jgi:peptidoglycan/LPS O-acetylase OafA/YrhL
MGNRLTQITTHVPALDGVRGIAILLVLAAHFGGGVISQSPIMRFAGNLMAGGWVGVDLFFALSGLLITGILLSTIDQPEFYRSFYGRRFLRIFPIYYLTLTVTLVISLASSHPWRWDQYSFFIFANNVVVVFDDNVGFVGPGLILSAFWSLAVEEQFYLFWPYLIRSAIRSQWLLWLFLSCLLTPLLLRIIFVNIGSSNSAFNLLISRMDALAAGGLLALLLRRGSLNDISPSVPIAIASTSIAGYLAIGLIEHTLNWRTGLMMTLGFELTGIASVAFIWSALIPRSPTQFICNAAVLRFFGKYSYGIYVYHLIFMIYMAKYLDPICRDLFRNPTLAAAAYRFSVVALVTVVSVISYHTFELKFLRQKSRFPYGERAKCNIVENPRV